MDSPRKIPHKRSLSLPFMSKSPFRRRVTPSMIKAPILPTIPQASFDAESSTDISPPRTKPERPPRTDLEETSREAPAVDPIPQAIADTQAKLSRLSLENQRRNTLTPTPTSAVKTSNGKAADPDDDDDLDEEERKKKMETQVKEKRPSRNFENEALADATLTESIFSLQKRLSGGSAFSGRTAASAPADFHGFKMVKRSSTISTVSTATSNWVYDDEDSDMELEMMAFHKSQASAAMQSDDHPKAERLLRKILNYQSKRFTCTNEERYNLLMDLHFVQLQQGKFEESSESLAEAAELATREQEISIEHALARLALKSGEPAAAQAHCKRAMAGRRKMYGKGHSLYYESVALMAEILDAVGEIDDAAFYKSLLSREYKRKSKSFGAIVAAQSPTPTRSGKPLFVETLERFNVTVDNRSDFPQIVGTQRDKQLAFDHAVECGDLDLMRLLLDEGASVNALTTARRSPLYCAATCGQIKAMKILLREGAKVNQLSTKDGYTPLHGAIACGRTGASVTSNSIVGGNMQILNPLNLLLDAGAELELGDSKGAKPLHICAQMADVGAALMLLARGADVDSRDSQGRTPLHHAAMCFGPGYDAAARALVEKGGADVNAKDDAGMTPLDHASDNPWKHEMVQVLRKNGAKRGFVEEHMKVKSRMTMI